MLKPSKHSSWWRHLEDVLKTSFAFVFRRRLDQEQHKRLGHTSSRRFQDVFKTSSRRLAKTSSKRLQDVFKTSSKRFQDIFKTSSRLIQNALKTSSRRLQDVLQRSLQDVFKMYHQVKLFLLTGFENDFETYSKCFWDVLQRLLFTEWSV